MKLKNLECILTAEKIVLYIDSSITIFTRNDDSEYYEDSLESNMFEQYGEHEVEQLDEGDYESTCICLKS